MRRGRTNRQDEKRCGVSDDADTTLTALYDVMVRSARIESKPRTRNYCMVSKD